MQFCTYNIICRHYSTISDTLNSEYKKKQHFFFRYWKIQDAITNLKRMLNKMTWEITEQSGQRFTTYDTVLQLETRILGSRDSNYKYFRI